MLLNIAKAYKMLQFSEGKADALNEVIGVLLRHTQRHSGKFLFWMLSLELHKNPEAVKIMHMLFWKMNIFPLILLLSRS